MTSGRECQGHFFFNGLGQSLGAKLVSTNDRPYSSTVFRLFPSGGEKQIAPHFAKPGWRYSRGMSVEISRNKRKI